MELYDENIEKIVLGSLIGSNKAYNEASSLLSEDLFYVTEYKRLFSCVKELVEKGMEPDILTVHVAMKNKGYQTDIPKLMDICSNRAMNVSQYTAILHDLSAKRKLILLSEEIKAKVMDFQSDPNEIISEITKKTSSFYRNEEGGISTSTDVILELQRNITKNASGKMDITGTATGFRKFDEATAGFHGGDLIFIAAESSQGKTSIALNISTYAAKCGEPIAWYSMEMSNIQLMARMVAAESGISSSSILYKPLSDEQIIDIDKVMGILSNCKIYFDDKSTSNIDSIESSIRFMSKKYGIKGALIDYIQLLTLNGRRGMSEEQMLGEYARRFKNLAKELDIWILALSQLNRDRLNPIPSDNRMRGSGQLKEAADTVIMIYRPEACDPPVSSYPSPWNNVDTHGTALVRITKGRNVGRMEFIVGFDAARTKFYDLDDTPQVNTAPPPTPDDIPDNIRKQIKEDNELPF